MKEITKFATMAGAPSDLLNVIDAPGSSIDVIFAEAILANKPTSILEEHNIITVKTAPADVDKIMFPVVRNKEFTWTELDPRTGSNVGSDITSNTVAQVEYRAVRPTLKSANIFLPDYVSLANKTDFEMYARLGAIEAQRKKEYDGLRMLGSLTSYSAVYSAGGFNSSGSTDAGSTIDPMDIIKAKKTLTTGSNVNVPDFIICHPATYASLNTHADFAPGATTNGAMMRKAKFNEDGDIVRFDGMDIYVTEQIRAVGSTSVTGIDDTNDRYKVLGHPIIVGTKGKALGRGEHQGIKVYTEDHRRFHGQFKIFDISYDHTVIVKESLILIVASD